MMRAILFGDKGMLDEEVLETFQKNGTAHSCCKRAAHRDYIRIYPQTLAMAQRQSIVRISIYLFRLLCCSCFILPVGGEGSAYGALAHIRQNDRAQI